MLGFNSSVWLRNTASLLPNGFAKGIVSFIYPLSRSTGECALCACNRSSSTIAMLVQRLQGAFVRLSEILGSVRL